MSARHYLIPMDTKQSELAQMIPTFKDLLDFVLANKTDKSFRGYTTEEIAWKLWNGLENKSLYYEQGLDGRVVGMILATTDSERKFMWVEENLAMNLNTLKRFAAKARIQFPGYTIEAKRHGHNVSFTLEKIYSKL